MLLALFQGVALIILRQLFDHIMLGRNLAMKVTRCVSTSYLSHTVTAVYS